MDQLPSNIRKDLLKLIPVSVYNETKCFELYDNHPSDDKLIEVIVCTQRGEIIEFYKREVVQSYALQNAQITDIKVLRNKNCDLYYLVRADDNIFLLSRKESIVVRHEIGNVSSFSLDDKDGKGHPCLKIIKNDDGVPLIFDDNFENLEEQLLISESQSQDTLPLLVQLRRKFSEAQYCVKFNEDKYKQLLNLRQQAIFHMYDTTAKDLQTSLKLEDVANLLQIDAQHPEVKLCNKKIIIMINILNKNSVPLEDVSIILHNTLKKTIKYKTKLFEETLMPPYWKEMTERIVNPNNTSCVVAVIDLEELQNSANSKVNFEIVISYSKGGKCFLLPFDKVHISPTDILGDNFDILARNNDNRITLLCVLSSCEKENLNLQHLPSYSEDLVTLHKIFCTHLKMEELFENVAIHKLSPFHPIHGVMIHLKKCYHNSFDIDVYTRSPSQILALVHYIYDAVPHRIIVLTKDIKISPLEDSPTEVEDELEDINTEELAKSIINQTEIMKEYFDECLVKMNENKNPIVQAKVGREIDIVALGKEKFLEFRRKILESTEKDIRITLLCVLSSCEKENLNLQHLPSNSEDLVTLHKIFCTHLKMEELFENVAIHKLSPFHFLHGVMIHFKKCYNNSLDINVYIRLPSQILALVHYIYDAVPHRIIVLTKDIKMSPLKDSPTEVEDNLEDINTEELAKSIINQTEIMKEYFDECLVKMNENKNPIVQAKVGREKSE